MFDFEFLTCFWKTNALSERWECQCPEISLPLIRTVENCGTRTTNRKRAKSSPLRFTTSLLTNALFANWWCLILKCILYQLINKFSTWHFLLAMKFVLYYADLRFQQCPCLLFCALRLSGNDFFFNLNNIAGEEGISAGSETSTTVCHSMVRCYASMRWSVTLQLSQYLASSRSSEQKL